jgi:hypothetical protein
MIFIMACKICQVRRPRRACPGVGGDICPPCCGNERENTVSCPLDCEYLVEARVHEKPQRVPEGKLPHPEVDLSEEFLHRQSELTAATGAGLATAALGVPGAVDQDVREALASLVETYRALQNGIYYESKPNNMVAARLQELIQRGLDEYRKSATEQKGMTTIRDADVLGVLVFFERMERQFSNGRRRSRSFIDFVRRQTGIAERPGAGASTLITP